MFSFCEYMFIAEATFHCKKKSFAEHVLYWNKMQQALCGATWLSYVVKNPGAAAVGMPQCAWSMDMNRSCKSTWKCTVSVHVSGALQRRTFQLVFLYDQGNVEWKCRMKTRQKATLCIKTGVWNVLLQRAAYRKTCHSWHQWSISIKIFQSS